MGTANRVSAFAGVVRCWDRLIAVREDSREIGIVASEGVRQAKVLMNRLRTWKVGFGLTEGNLDMLIAGRLASIFAACVRQRLRPQWSEREMIMHMRGGRSPRVIPGSPNSLRTESR